MRSNGCIHAGNRPAEYHFPVVLACIREFGILRSVKKFKILVEKHADGYVAYPVGIKGVVVGQGDTYEEALRDVRSALKFHLETFGPDALDPDEPVLEAFVAEAAI